MRKKYDSHGFALPTILITSVVMLIVLISAVSAATSVRIALDNQYYGQLAREAAESGIAKAVGCLKSNNYVVQWNNASSLWPHTPCTGGTFCSSSANCFLFEQGNVRSRFHVILPEDTDTGSMKINSEGTVEVLKSSGSIWRRYESTASVQIGNDNALNVIMFGQ